MGHKYTYVKVGHVGAQIYISKSGDTLGKWGTLRHKYTFVKGGTLKHKYTFVKVEIHRESGVCWDMSTHQQK